MDIVLELAQVNHRRCVEVLLPRLVEHCAAKTQPNELDRFLAELGADAAPAACALLDEMDVDRKDRMIVWLVSAHETRMRNSANRHLAELLGRDVIRIGRFFALDRPGSRLSLCAADVAVDWSALLHSEAVRDGVEQLSGENSILKGAAMLVLRMSAHLPNESLEKQGVALLNSDLVKRRLMSVLQDAVRQEGLDVTLEDLSVRPSDLSSAAAAPDLSGVLSPAFEREWKDALLRKRAELHQ